MCKLHLPGININMIKKKPKKKKKKGVGFLDVAMFREGDKINTLFIEGFASVETLHFFLKTLFLWCKPCCFMLLSRDRWSF